MIASQVEGGSMYPTLWASAKEDLIHCRIAHRRDQEVPVEDLMQTLLAFKAEGKIGGFGFSEISPATLRRATAVGTVDAVQSEYSLWTRQPELGMIQACKEMGVTFVPFSPLGRGMFAAQPPDPGKFEKGHFRTGTPRFSEPNFSYNIRMVNAFNTLVRDLDTSPAILAIAWCLARGEHLIPIPGTRTADNLKECVAGSSFAMTDDIMKSIEQVLPVGWAHGDRYTHDQWVGVEGYCRSGLEGRSALQTGMYKKPYSTTLHVLTGTGVDPSSEVSLHFRRNMRTGAWGFRHCGSHPRRNS